MRKFFKDKWKISQMKCYGYAANTLQWFIDSIPLLTHEKIWTNKVKTNTFFPKTMEINKFEIFLTRGLVQVLYLVYWFNGTSTFVGYLMSKPSL